MASTPFIVVGAVTAAFWIAARTGRLGECVIKINKDDEDESVSRGLFWETAYWKDADCYIPLYRKSFRPIRFEYTNEYGGIYYFPPADSAGNKN